MQHAAVGSESAWYALKRRTVVVRHVSDDSMVALVEVLSPGNKDRESSMERFVEKCWSAIAEGIHVSVVDLFPPNRHNPNGIHGEIWAGLGDDPYFLPSGKSMTAAAYEATIPVRTYVQPLAVGDELPNLPLFIEPGIYVDLALGLTYDAAFANTPQRWRRVVEGRADR
jgi:hypothetical protein